MRQSVANLTLVEGTSYRAQVEETIKTLAASYQESPFWKRLVNEKLDISYYHAILKGIFHQTYLGPSTFALAGANCKINEFELREYFLKHAEEEKSHWMWVLDDLRNTGYKGTDPRDEFPSISCQAYIGYNFFTAQKMPIARIGIALMLEYLGAEVGEPFGKLLVQNFDIKKNQVTFFLRHGSTDKIHIEGLWEIIEQTKPNAEDWKWIHYSVKVAAELYKAIYNEALK